MTKPPTEGSKGEWEEGTMHKLQKDRMHGHQ